MMNNPEMHAALDSVFGGNLTRWMEANDNTPPQSLRDGIAAVILAAFYGAVDAADLSRHLEAAEKALWSARREVERIREGY